MPRNTFQRLMALVLLGISGAGAFGCGGATAAGPTVNPATYILRGTGPFSTSIATAIVTHLSSDRFRLSLTAAHLPRPTLLHMKFARHAYVAWLVNGGIMHGPLRIAAVGLVATGRSGTYAGQGIVIISGVTAVMITAEPTAQAYMPIMPVRIVLTSANLQ